MRLTLRVRKPHSSAEGEEMARGKGSCGGTRKMDGSGRGVGQKTKQKPKGRK